MLNLPDCPICGEPAEWQESISEKNEKVYFCMECCEHFLEKDTIETKIKSAINENSIIDEVFLKFMNRAKKC